jgi:hypothetical protein
MATVYDVIEHIKLRLEKDILDAMDGGAHIIEFPTSGGNGFAIVIVNELLIPDVKLLVSKAYNRPARKIRGRVDPIN